ncbi:MAG: dual specificity protein phosphatase family protein [Ignavibacteria bacterium]|nr:dual specificity protein phosphatase family protein [Ignavibacteria bacterium]
MELFQIDAGARLFISPDIDDWAPLESETITVIFDLDDNLDIGVPTVPGEFLYVYFPFEDRELPDLDRLHVIARMGAHLVEDGYKVLSHCGMGHNRSALLAGLILTYLGLSGEEAVNLIRSRRQGALYNKNYANYLIGLPSAREERMVGLEW